jgi:phosphatidylglycerophosphate synthase
MFPRLLFPGQSRTVFLMLGALFIQMRLLCNVLDGLIAIEGGKRTKYGELFNEIPDRISDTVLLVSAGYSSGSPEAGWAAALCALLTAYIRSFAAQYNAEQDFCGPMAKQQRMFLLTFALVLRAVLENDPIAPAIIPSALVIIAVGSLFTAGRRLSRCVSYISSKD